MKGLLLKDILNFKKQGLIYIFLIALWFFIGIRNKDIYYLSGVIAMVTLLIPITVISYDEKANWERYALTMPISKGTIVISRYLLTICVSIIGGVFSTIAGILISTNIKEVLLTNMSVISLGLLVISFAFPPSFLGSTNVPSPTLLNVYPDFLAISLNILHITPWGRLYACTLLLSIKLPSLGARLK